MIAALIRLGAGDGAAELGERVGEILGETLRVGLALVDQDRDPLDAEAVLVFRVGGEARHHVALKWIDEAHAEHVVADLGHLGVGRRRRDHRRLVLLRDLPACDRERRGDLADHRQHLVLRDEARDGGADLGRLALVVVADELDLLALDAAGGVDFLDGHGEPVVRGLAEGGFGAGHRAIFTDDDFVAGRELAAAVLGWAAAERQRAYH